MQHSVAVLISPHVVPYKTLHCEWYSHDVCVFILNWLILDSAYLTLKQEGTKKILQGPGRAIPSPPRLC